MAWYGAYCLYVLWCIFVRVQPSSNSHNGSHNHAHHLGNRRPHVSPSRDHMVVVVVVCARPGSMLATLFKILLHSITLYKAPEKRVTVIAMYDPATAGDHPAALLCEEDGGRVTAITETFVKYLAARRVAVDFRPIDTGNRFLDRWGRCASSKVRAVRVRGVSCGTTLRLERKECVVHTRSGSCHVDMNRRSPPHLPRC